jgi:type II/IV secretion system protein/type II secretion system (T2SS) protein E
MSRELESLLLRSGAITAQELARSIGLASARNIPLWDFLVLERQVPEDILADAFSTWLNLPRVRLDSVVIDAEVLNVISSRLARKHTCLPIRFSGQALLLAMANPLDRQAIKDVEYAASRPVRPVVAARTEVLAGIQRCYPGVEGVESNAPVDASPGPATELEAPPPAIDIPPLDSLGLSADELSLLGGVVEEPQGLIIVTGPTGAGTTTTLYSLLTSRVVQGVNVTTIEDPIEYHVPGANQVQVDGTSGLTFAECLRATLKQDPEVVLVGEIRDPDTAEVVFQAALTGHLVFSTLRADDAIGAIERFLDLGITPVVLTSATSVIVAQRLARRVCSHCLERYSPAPEALRRLQIQADDHEFRRGRGCEACAQTGYSGRVGIFEILQLTPRVKELVIRQAPESEIRSAAWADGTRFLMEDALTKVRAGLTTVEEILRVIRTDRAEDRGPHDPARTLPRLDARRPIDPWLLYEQ